MSFASSPTEPKRLAWWRWKATSSTTEVWPVYVWVGSRMWDDLVEAAAESTQSTSASRNQWTGMEEHARAAVAAGGGEGGATREGGGRRKDTPAVRKHEIEGRGCLGAR